MSVALRPLGSPRELFQDSGLGPMAGQTGKASIPGTWQQASPQQQPPQADCPSCERPTKARPGDTLSGSTSFPESKKSQRNRATALITSSQGMSSKHSSILNLMHSFNHTKWSFNSVTLKTEESIGKSGEGTPSHGHSQQSAPCTSSCGPACAGWEWSTWARIYLISWTHVLYIILQIKNDPLPTGLCEGVAEKQAHI